VQCGTARSRAWRGGEKAASGHRIEFGSQDRVDGRCRRSRPSKVSKEAVDRFSSHQFGFDGQMCVEAGSGRRTVTEIGLNEPKVDSSFEEMGCPKMSQRMDRGWVVDATFF